MASLPPSESTPDLKKYLATKKNLKIVVLLGASVS